MKKIVYNEEDILDSVLLWGSYFEIRYIRTNEDGSEFWLCKNSKRGYSVCCNSEIQAHKICWVAHTKFNNRYPSKLDFGTTVNRKANNLIGEYF